MVSLNSVYPNEYRLGKFLCAYLAKHGFLVMTQRVAAKRFNIFARRGAAKKAVMFYGHLDTVPVINPTKWRTDPFHLTHRQGRLYGLGTYDMKGGIAAFLDASVRSDSYIKIFLAVDEEWISEGAWTAIKHRRDFFSDVNLVISPEPNFGLGTYGIVRGRTGRFIFTVNFDGKPAHVAQYQESVDAVSMMGKFISDFYAAREKLFLSGGTFVQIRRVTGEAIGMSVCGNASVDIEVLGNYQDSISDIQGRLQSLTDVSVRVKARKTPYLPGYFFSTFPYQQSIANIIRFHTKKEMKLHVRQSVSDDNVLATLGIPVITWGPSGGNAHEPNEYVEKSSLETLSKMFHDVLVKSAVAY
jgi:acetylornithine deacetylase/succinyl-diaminopimelate desuccinylase-like protein